MKYILSSGESDENGLNSKILHGIDEFVQKNRYRLLRSILVIRNDKIVFERYYNNCDENSMHELHSIEKNLVSTAVGICLKNGTITSLDVPITEILPQYFNNEVNVFHKLITLKSLLTMTSGLYWRNGAHLNDPMRQQLKRSKDWIQTIADCDIVNTPNMVFQYKVTDIWLLCICIEKLTGKSIYKILNESMFQYLDITCEPFFITPTSLIYSNNVKVNNAVYLSARDLSKLGLLYLHNGKLNGQEILSEEYVKEATISHINNYGYYWWINEDGSGYRALGRGGQELHIYPYENLIVVLQAEDSRISKFYTPVISNVILKALE